ncbi:MAG TPA: type VI secretion system lipoprotein TssJ [Stellaceae bacterium]|jgi:type VI secretion system protein VasD|nr:type VI secretion system lipoprotein TssJ [Stellaceae bacterium]
MYLSHRPAKRVALTRYFISAISAWRAAALLALALLSACASSGPIPVSVQASSDVNPDLTGRASPIVTRVYQLADKDKFMLADPIQLIQHDSQTLGADEIGRDEFILQPGDKHTITIPENDKIKYVGFVAAYRAIDQDTWRQIVPVPTNQRLSLTVTVGATGLDIQQGQP